MSNYRRVRVPGGTWFFTLVTADRRPWLGTHEGRRALADSMRRVRSCTPFDTIAIVVLPDHLHVIWKLPAGDSDFPSRWQRIKHRTTARARKRLDLRGPVWQPRYWEHLIRDATDLERHVDYIHFNPVKHDLCKRPADWPASSFHRYVQAGMYPRDWGGPADDLDIPE